MKVKHGIPQEQLEEIIDRDTVCVYCRKRMIQKYDIHNRSDSPTIEHLNHRADWHSIEDFLEKGKPVNSIVAISCGACNSSRGSKPLLTWFESAYCQSRDISLGTVSKVVVEYISEYEK